jgi:hypothetical protein
LARTVCTDLDIRKILDFGTDRTISDRFRSGFGTVRHISGRFGSGFGTGRHFTMAMVYQ